MAMIKAILACDDTGGVSKDGTLPWPNNSKDLAWFKSCTSGHIVVMGSTTWEDPHMPRPLPNRTNVLVTTRKEDYPGADGYIEGDLNAELKELEATCPGLIIWAIGGPKIIEQSLGVIDEFRISRIPGDYDCDTHLPLKKIETLFELDFEEVHEEVTFQIWRKRETVS
jgi:dihydrofolate reductase